MFRNSEAKGFSATVKTSEAGSEHGAGPEEAAEKNRRRFWSRFRRRFWSRSEQVPDEVLEKAPEQFRRRFRKRMFGATVRSAGS